jgi:hypothetical protein
MEEIVLIDTENVGYNVINTLNMEKVIKLILIDGPRIDNIKLEPNVLKILFNDNYKQKIERIYTDIKEENAADYLLIMKIGMLIPNIIDKSNILIKIFSGDKIFKTVARLLNEININIEINNIHDNTNNTIIEFNDIDFYTIADKFTINDILMTLKKLWCHDRSFIKEKLQTCSNKIIKRTGICSAIKIVIQQHPQYYSKDDNFVYFKSLD